jgi:phage replication initiation protein
MNGDPLSNTGEKLQLANQLLSQLRKSQIETIVADTISGQDGDEDQKQKLTAEFDIEVQTLLEQLHQGYRDYPLLSTVMVINEKGESVHQLMRLPATGQIAVTDWINFSVHKKTFDDIKREKLGTYSAIEDTDGFAIDTLFTNSDYAYAMSKVLKDIFGFGIESKMPKGMNYYEEAYKLENNCGYICTGGQNDTMLVMINALGCTLGNYGWEEDLHAWLRLFAYRPKITRLDLAHDDFESKNISIAWAKEQFDLGGYKGSMGRPPKFNVIGDYWTPDGSGSTVYVGSRKSHKYTRIYEKGKQLGQKDSTWMRAEVEYKSKNAHIPLDAMLDASEYFISAYPCFHAMQNAIMPKKMEIIKKTARIVWEKGISTTVHQFGKYIAAFRDYYNDDSLVLDLLTHEVEEYPKRLEALYLNYSNSMPPEAMPA